jgi:hypothetical protein
MLASYSSLQSCKDCQECIDLKASFHFVTWFGSVCSRQRSLKCPKLHRGLHMMVHYLCYGSPVFISSLPFDACNHLTGKWSAAFGDCLSKCGNCSSISTQASCTPCNVIYVDRRSFLRGCEKLASSSGNGAVSATNASSGCIAALQKSMTRRGCSRSPLRHRSMASR